MSANEKPVWFITGCSTGFGRELARYTLSLGYPTVVTARNPSQVEDLVKGVKQLKKDFETWADVSEGADFPEGEK